MADQKPTLDDALRQIMELRKRLDDQARTITFMQRMGGFADSKTLSMRASRMEKRIELIELDGEMLKDVAGLHVAVLEDHLKDRHEADLDRDNAIDVINFRKIRRRLHEWAAKRGLIGKRTDLRQSRQDENRLRPALQS